MNKLAAVMLLSTVLLFGCELDIRSGNQQAHDEIERLERSYRWEDCRDTQLMVKDTLKYVTWTCVSAYHKLEQETLGKTLIFRCRCVRDKLTDKEAVQARNSVREAVARRKLRPKGL